MDQTPQELLQMQVFNEFKIGSFLGSDDTLEQREHANMRAIEFLTYVNLIPRKTGNFYCNKTIAINGINSECGTEMSVRSDRNKKIGYRLFCRGRRAINGRHAIFKPSPLIGTIFEKSRVEFRQFMKMIYYFMTDRNVTDLIKLCHMNSQTAIQWYAYIREAVTTCAWHEYNKIGGYGDVVEIDETLLFHRKNHVGRIYEDVWAFGGISRTTNNVFATWVERRNSNILEEEVMDCISPGTFICSDGWAAYNNLRSLPRDNSPRYFRGHDVVIHQENFVSPPRGEDPLWVTDYNIECTDQNFVGPSPLPNHLPLRIHTQKIEVTWRYLKKHIKSSRDINSVNNYIGEFMYKNNILSRINGTANKFYKLCNDISNVYPGLSRKPIKANKPNFWTNRDIGNGRGIDICECNNCT